MKFLDNKTPKVHFENINAFIIAEMFTNKIELAQVNGYGDISAND